MEKDMIYNPYAEFAPLHSLDGLKTKITLDTEKAAVSQFHRCFFPTQQGQHYSFVFS